MARKRSIVSDALGLLSAALVAAAHPTLRKVWVDGGCRQHLVEYAATFGTDVVFA